MRMRVERRFDCNKVIIYEGISGTQLRYAFAICRLQEKQRQRKMTGTNERRS